MWENLLLELLKHRGKIGGLLISFLFAYFVIAFGFWRTFFVIICLYIGLIIGKRIDDNESLRGFIEQFLNDRN